MENNEKIEITELEIQSILSEIKWKADVASAVDEIIIHARWMNFQVGERYDPKSLHGTNYIHDLLKRRVITNETYQKLKRVVEDESITYDIVI
jgi:hypothetical protein